MKIIIKNDEILIELLHLLIKDVIELKAWCNEFAPSARLMRSGIVDGAVFDLDWHEYGFDRVVHLPKYYDIHYAWGIIVNTEEAPLVKLTWAK